MPESMGIEYCAIIALVEDYEGAQHIIPCSYDLLRPEWMHKTAMFFPDRFSGELYIERTTRNTKKES